MEFTVEINVSDDIGVDLDEVPEPALLQSWAAAAYLKRDDASEVAFSEVLVSIMVSSRQEIQQLNKQYRGNDNATNVLSFPMSSPEDIDVQLLGDIALCPSIIKEEAKQQSKSSYAHWAHMVVHGMLHLQGYDHSEDTEAEEMETLEIKVLQTLGFENPYE